MEKSSARFSNLRIENAARMEPFGYEARISWIGRPRKISWRGRKVPRTFLEETSREKNHSRFAVMRIARCWGPNGREDSRCSESWKRRKPRRQVQGPKIPTSSQKCYLAKLETPNLLDSLWVLKNVKPLSKLEGITKNKIKTVKTKHSLL